MNRYEQQLLNRLPMKYHKYFKGIEAEDGLVDDCRYMLYFNEGVSLFGYEEVYGYPVKSISEAIRILKQDCSIEQ